jgi:hypothetical protein
MTIFDVMTPADYTVTGRTDCWQQSEGKPYMWLAHNPKKYCENEIINELMDDLEKLIPGVMFCSYRVWNHVPNLGKRLWARVDLYQIDTDISGISEKYKAKNLEISVNVIPNFDQDSWSAYISSMWTTKTHKEV